MIFLIIVSMTTAICYEIDWYFDRKEDPLYRIRHWPQNDFYGMLEFCKAQWEPMGWKHHAVETKENNTWIFHTFGNSENQEIIKAMQDNRAFWFLMWESSTRGGHHTFKPIY